MKKVVTVVVVICLAIVAGYWVLSICSPDFNLYAIGETVSILFGGLFLVIGIATLAGK
ncbi:MAG: hypothetical protein K2X93_16095 [Candidatus Obscuribacterales bacterium]|nr:hypothetical protein [Candidatus Obscuribacterales bacterium]